MKLQSNLLYKITKSTGFHDTAKSRLLDLARAQRNITTFSG